ncbi:UDP-glucose/GDP-mannose dehydrogenase family protein [Janthinobacterium sp. 17J80-10]|uniref:UDP-glucose dehydrogenase family protein n=1 Tax=Janthinobacterium sp. 17J80-10 TaxID=2497863 RepID=UPI001005A64C|nr:UDP-glucose/GDP-mannose dehydrogenase family protein [Janthinobacterium sp. 17J80-10]QAU35400.1 UDP-glucose/GDP-mannose dehydrogenase family protein [Janthinobacterium sp. 17J80-10]
MKITIIGTGYVGLVSGACFADFGNSVLCLDVDARKVDMLKAGSIPIHEPGLDELVARNSAAGRIAFTTSYDEAVEHAEVIFLAVGTPPDEDGSADLTHILSAARSIGARLNRPVVVVDKSTVPVGTADSVRKAISQELERRSARIDFAVVSNPEFLKEGAAIEDFMRPDRIIIGSDDEQATRVMRQLYAPFSRNRDKMIEMDVRSAELTKYAANAMLATRISFMNELANLAEELDADIEAVRLGIGSDPRIGPHFLYSGMGYGGSCFPKDVKALLKTSVDHGRTLHLLKAIENVNESQKAVLFEKIARHFGGRDELRGKTIALWGLSFKPNTDDMREAPSLVLIQQLLQAGARVRAYDPVATEEAARILQTTAVESLGSGQLALVASSSDAIEDADALVLVTEWKEFRAPDFSLLASTLRGKAIFDGRNQYDPAIVRAAGLRYYGIGRRNPWTGQ